MPEETLIDIKPRKYQLEIYEKCKDKNCLVVLPTGIGKTLIALMLTIYTQKKIPGGKTLFLAPTRPLAEQHLAYYRKYLPELFGELSLFTGKTNAKKRKNIWESSNIIFSTPQCIRNDLNNGLYDLSEVSLLIIDESHRCLKNYAYTHVTARYKEQGVNQKVLGMTASPGTNRKTIEQIAENLGIESIEIRTRESEDVKPYLEELEFKVIRLEYPKEFKEIDEIAKKLYNIKIEELKNRKLLFGPPIKSTILKLQEKLMNQIRSGNRSFNVLLGVSATAQAIKLSHLIELLETQTLYGVNNYLNNIYKQAAQKKSKAVVKLVSNSEFNKINIMVNELLSRNLEHPKILELKELIKDYIKNDKNKTIIFSQYRDTVVKINEEINKIKGIRSKVFVGQAKKANSGLSQKEQQEIMDEFRKGLVNVICATSIAEEGLDIPEVNSVIFYEPIPSAIRKIQRAGRTARLMKGKLIILLTLDTLDEIYYYASLSREKKMYKTIDSIKKDLDDGKPLNNSNKEQKRLF